jgi:hypothetical protein
MKYIIDMIDDLRENINNSKEYTLLAMLLKEDDEKNLQNAGEKVITSLHVNHESKCLEFGFFGESVTTAELLEMLNSLDMQSMMYEVVLKISDAHPIMPVIGFGENHEEKQYIVFVTTN